MKKSLLIPLFSFFLAVFAAPISAQQQQGERIFSIIDSISVTDESGTYMGYVCRAETEISYKVFESRFVNKLRGEEFKGFLADDGDVAWRMFQGRPYFFPSTHADVFYTPSGAFVKRFTISRDHYSVNLIPEWVLSDTGAFFKGFQRGDKFFLRRYLGKK